MICATSEGVQGRWWRGPDRAVRAPRKVSYLVWGFVAPLCLLAAGAKAAPTEAGWPEPVWAALSESGFERCAIALVVTSRDEPVILHWPEAEVGAAPTPERFRAGSISKLLTSLLVLRAVEAEILRLDDPVEAALPGIFTGDEEWGQAVTMAHLLEHTAGLPGSDYAEYAAQAPALSPREYVETRRPFRLRWAPGFHYSYANSGHTIAAAVVEKAWQLPFDEVIEREVLGPLGMTNTSFENTPDAPGLVPSFDANGGRITTTWAMPVRPSGSVITTASDLGKVVTMLLRRGSLPSGERFLKEASIKRMERGELSLAGRAGAVEGTYGLGNFNFRAGHSMWRGHWGRTEGFQANLGYDPAAGRGFVVLSNTAGRSAMGVVREAIVEALGPDSGRPPWETRPITELPSTNGVFVNHSHDMPSRSWIFGMIQAVRIEPRADRLTVSPASPFGGSKLTFLHLGDGLFAGSEASVATATLAEAEGGTFFIDGESYRRVSTVRFRAAWWAFGAGLASAVLIFASLAGRGIGRLFTRPSEPDAASRRRRHSWRWLGVGAGAHLAVWGLFIGFGLLGGTANAAALGRPSLVSLALLSASVVAPLAVALALFPRPGGWWAGLLGVGLLFGIGLQAVNGWVPLLSW
jgi:CubicO group peptidase (beta-lactamase class C family)